jgi:DNA-binding transcriptional LysR family regulator
MNTRELLKIDLNLLVALQVLLEERTVSNAARRMFITQPAMSKTLARLRAVFDDPLFTRGPSGMEPTPRARQLEGDLSKVLQDIQHLVAAREFDPAAWEGDLTIAVSEHIGMGLMPGLIRRLQREAPLLNLKSVTRVERQLTKLASGEVDVAIQIKYAHYGPDFVVHELGSSQPVIMLRDDHPALGSPTDPEMLNHYPMLRLYIPDLEALEIVRRSPEIAAARLRRGAFETSHLLTALDVLRQTDYLMPAPPFVLRNPAASQGITEIPIPGIGDFEISYMLVRHRRTSASPGHLWFWRTVLSEIEAAQRELG